MKNLALFFALLFVGGSASASSTNNSSSYPIKSYGESFIFVEGGVEFAIYPNGEFDFYYDPHFTNNSSKWSNPRSNISYNSGYNYDPYVQYDDYGAVVQIENVPVYYDYYGRITQAGRINIDYNRNGIVSRVGGLNIRYNNFNQPVYYSGYINNYNRGYVYRPWHDYYVRPFNTHSVVYYQPYRTYYEPVRMNYGQYVSYYNSNKHHYKNKRDFYRPESNNVVYHNGRRTSEARNIKPFTRSSDNTGRRSDNVVTRNSSERESQDFRRNRTSDARISTRNEISKPLDSNNNVRSSSRISSDITNNHTGENSTQRTISRERDNANRINNTTYRSQEANVARNAANTRATSVRSTAPQRSSIDQRGRGQSASNAATTAQRVPNKATSENVRNNRSLDLTRGSRTITSSRGNSRTSEMR